MSLTDWSAEAPLEVRRAAADAYRLIEAPDRWCTGWSGRDRLGRPVAADSPDAHARCGAGALWVATDAGHGTTLFRAALIYVERACGHRLLSEVNDFRGHAAMLAALAEVAGDQLWCPEAPPETMAAEGAAAR